MKKSTIAALAMLLLFGAALVQITCAPKGSQPLTQEELVKRGEYMVLVGGCNDCHTPKRMGAHGMPTPDPSILLSGHPANAPIAPLPTGVPDMNGWIGLTNMHMTAWAGPWGISFASNLTPDPQAGLGMWTEKNFIDAIRTGKHMGSPDGRMILPPMPWESMAKMTDDDLKAIFAYLRTLPAVPNLVPSPMPPAMSEVPPATEAPTN